MAIAGAGVLLTRPGPEVLAITRGFATDDLSFPGGTYDRFDASARHTAARELREETGIVVEPYDLLYMSHCRTPRGGLFVVYIPQKIRSWPEVLKSEPFEGFVGWHPPQKLTIASKHARFQKRVLEQVGLLP